MKWSAIVPVKCIFNLTKTSFEVVSVKKETRLSRSTFTTEILIYFSDRSVMLINFDFPLTDESYLSAHDDENC